MPNRIFRDTTNSDKIDKISWQAEVFFYRLMMKADDYGCYWADEKRLRANLFVLKLDKIREADMSRWMTECHDAGLVALYEFEGKKYLQIIDFGQRKRQMKRLFPCPPVVSDSPATRQPEREEEKEEKENIRPPSNLENSNLFRKPTIPTKQQVLEAMIDCGGTKEMAKSFYEKYDGTGWYLNGSPITNFKTLASRFVTNWKGLESKVNPEAPSINLKKI